MMIVVVLFLGFIALAAGMFGLGIGVPARDTTFGAAMLISASVALTGGFILLGLAAAVSGLRRALQAGMRSVRAPERHEAGREGARRMEPRLAMPGSAGGTSGDDAADVIPTRFDAPEPAQRPRMPPRDERPASDAGHARAAASPIFQPVPGPAAEQRRAPPSPASFGAASAGASSAPPADSPERLDAIRPAHYRRLDAEEPEGQLEHTEAPPVAVKEMSEAKAPSSPVESLESGAVRPLRIVKSGVINDVAYTFFSDGSIETETSSGTQRFASLDEFRRYMEKSA